jgi:hypothetical protein
MLLSDLDPGFEIEYGEFAWNPDNSLSMTFRISVTRPSRKGEIWEIGFSYPANEATAVRPDATPQEREWFTRRAPEASPVAQRASAGKAD